VNRPAPLHGPSRKRHAGSVAALWILLRTRGWGWRVGGKCVAQNIRACRDKSGQWKTVIEGKS